LLWRTKAAGRAVLLALVLLGTLTVQLGLAGDISRSASVVVPALLAGLMMIWSGWQGRWVRPALVGVCAVNCLLPTEHVVTSTPVSLIPVYYLHASLGELRQPPDQFNPLLYAQRAAMALQAQKPAEARQYL